jgi:hypothetical protein
MNGQPTAMVAMVANAPCLMPRNEPAQVNRRRDRFGHQLRSIETGAAGGLDENVAAARPPGGRMRQRQRGDRCAGDPDGLVAHFGQQRGDQIHHRQLTRTEQHRVVVDAPLGRRFKGLGSRGGTVQRGGPDQHGVRCGQHRRRHDRGAVEQQWALPSVGAPQYGDTAGGTEIDAEPETQQGHGPECRPLPLPEGVAAAE